MAGLLLVHGEVGEARSNAEEALQLARAADAMEEEVLANGVIGDCLLLEGEVDAGIDLRLQATNQSLDELRTEAEAKLGDRFKLADFHDAVLAGGAVTLPLLRQRVEAYIAK